MKRLFIISLCIGLPFVSYTQNDSTKDLEAYFSAMIVSDLDSSIHWYSTMLGFEEVNRTESTERGFKQSNLERGDLLIELIELDKAVKVKDIVPGYNNKMRFIGFFKVGFRVVNFEKWITHLTNEKVNFYGSIVTDDNTGKRMVIVTDPDNNRIQLFEK